MRTYLLDPDRDQIRAVLLHVVNREAQRLHAEFLQEHSFATTPWESDSDRTRDYWLKRAWRDVCRSIGREMLPPDAAD